MTKLEYKRIVIGEDLTAINALAAVGWRVVAVERAEPYPMNLDLMPYSHWALMERDVLEMLPKADPK